MTKRQQKSLRERMVSLQKNMQDKPEVVEQFRARLGYTPQEMQEAIDAIDRLTRLGA